MSELMSCDHKHRSFVQSGNGTGGKHHVYICEDCGKVMISMSKGGVHFSLNFHIQSPDQLDMIRKWTDYVWDGRELETDEVSR